VIERVGCSWQSEDWRTSVARRNYADSAQFHHAHGDDLSKCDALDLRLREDRPARRFLGDDESSGTQVEPTTSDWLGYVKCNECGRVYDHEGMAISGPGKLSV